MFTQFLLKDKAQTKSTFSSLTQELTGGGVGVGGVGVCVRQGEGCREGCGGGGSGGGEEV